MPDGVTVQPAERLDHRLAVVQRGLTLPTRAEALVMHQGWDERAWRLSTVRGNRGCREVAVPRWSAGCCVRMETGWLDYAIIRGAD